MAGDEGLLDEESRNLQQMLELAKDALISDPQQLPIQLLGRLNSRHGSYSSRLLERAVNPRFPCLITSSGVCCGLYLDI